MGRKDDDELCRAALAHDLGEQFQLGRWVVRGLEGGGARTMRACFLFFKEKV